MLATFEELADQTRAYVTRASSAWKMDRARVRGLHEVVPETLHPLDPSADLLAADEVDFTADYKPWVVANFRAS